MAKPLPGDEEFDLEEDDFEDEGNPEEIQEAPATARQPKPKTNQMNPSGFNRPPVQEKERAVSSPPFKQKSLPPKRANRYTVFAQPQVEGLYDEAIGKPAMTNLWDAIAHICNELEEIKAMLGMSVGER